ncbi:hypothetical protein [Pseudoalteromonas sp. Angola-18]|uniref:hypothetical protein n=1 Tax=Pseudoalteromonas sp. Angola-18 TaxID=3025338 RepID=UPI0023586026|nr:hypothetical protein [Pseudoalteromonas sp. Angola-18]MDC9502987.1 hypothetical protein [Pseudoalteromonas sp. Angola-18]
MNIKTRVILKCNDTTRKSIRIILYEDNTETFVRLDICGTGINFEYEEFVAGGFKREHLAYERLEEEITCLEQIGFEVAKRNDTPVEIFDLNTLKSKPILPLSYSKLEDKQIKGLIGHPCLEVYSGLQVAVVFDEFYNVTIYPANKIGIEGAALPLPESYTNMIKVAFKRLGLGLTVIEGFYSAKFGFIGVDAAIFNGRKLNDKLYSERIKLMRSALDKVKSSTFKSAEFKTSTRANLGCAAYSIRHSSVLFLKKEKSVPLSLMNEAQSSIDTLIIDDLMPARASLSLVGDYIECLNVTTGEITKRPSVFYNRPHFNFFEYASVACTREGNLYREPVVFY